MEQEKKMEYITKKECVLTGITARKSKTNEECEKVTFRTNIGDITWKPKTIKKSFRCGIEVEETVMHEIDMLPKKLQDWAKMLAEKGHMQVTIDYTKMTVDKDGTPTEYRFITSEKTLNENWILREEVKVEKVD